MHRPLRADPRFRGLLFLTLAAAGCGKKPPPDVSGATAPAKPTAPTGPTFMEIHQAEVERRTGIPAPSEKCRPYADLIGDETVLDLTVDAGHVEIRQRSEEHPDRVRSWKSGEACWTAVDEAACQTALDEAWSAGHMHRICGQMGCDVTQLVWSNEHDVGAAVDEASLLELLGPINTADEAILWTWAKGFFMQCPPDAVDDAWEIWLQEEVKDCPRTHDHVRLKVGKDGSVEELDREPGQPGPCAGRFPPGLEDLPMADGSVGSWLARTAHLEAAAVQAFQLLAAELAHHGAPKSLVEAALAAAQDEVRHAQIIGNLARTHGCEPSPIGSANLTIRSLREIAADNAREGLGRECWGAMIGLWQAEHASDLRVRQAMTAVALDEVRHAELSRAIDAWIRTRLTPNEQSLVDVSLDEAWRTLARDAVEPLPADVCAQLGMPSASEARQLLAAARATGLAVA